MARPKLDPDKRRSERVVTYVTPSDLLRGIARAEQAGVTNSEYAYERYVNGRIVIKQYRQLEHSVIDQLRRIGVNLNQLTHLAHIKKNAPASLPRLLRHIEQLLTEQFDESRRKQ